ncbi:ribosomal protein L15 [Paracoccidioides brasiliensis Pb03]|uniref:Ribosomal protein L15 n=2 Tax=Paracoccidioides brasiliensis TaxID=121759 RepID=C1G4W7_PARBD|nr:ribosomal protein L15 [Paracoccidioides brasiliensis Pb18]EEH21182.1 ribosomal protein L15 [Paracoccidioides brasiliensis Pb03]EEH45833.1 ribosomal protein L15 [Paracoccidioides brasiliensis Pb18]ODH12581.1 ribosomal protein L15 [Paracoccidioides brasiliensis]ODH53008.1 ribosomal protein L15 [Paracoccidioides brasiliensis]
MPPRLSWRLPMQLPSLFHAVYPPSLSAPILQHQTRHASILGSLSDNATAYNKRIRRGRGPSSGKGKTSGRGHKGQKQHGKVPAGFNGGQTKDEIVHGERGFDNMFSLDISKVNVDRIQEWIDQGRLDPSRPITVRELAKSRCIHGVKDGVKLLGRGGKDALKQPIQIVVSRASATAIEAVEAAGGSITTRYYTRHAIKRIMSGKTDPFVSLAWLNAGENLTIGMGVDKPRIKGNGFTYRLPDPTNRKDIEYYRDPAHRGYLSYLVEKGETPSLFFRAPGKTHRKGKEVVPSSDNRLW